MPTQEKHIVEKRSDQTTPEFSESFLKSSSSFCFVKYGLSLSPQITRYRLRRVV